MKYIFFILLIIANLYGKNPIQSPTFDEILKPIIEDKKYIFDDENITIEVPNFADNPVQVPIFVDAKKIKNAKQLILFADLNPIPVIVDMKLIELLPLISLNIKVAQETHIRALVLDDKNVSEETKELIAILNNSAQELDKIVKEIIDKSKEISLNE